MWCLARVAYGVKSLIVGVCPEAYGKEATSRGELLRGQTRGFRSKWRHSASG